MTDARIVSLVPSLTELLCELGLADRLVGRTGFCVHPRDVVRSIAKVGGTKDVKLDRVRELVPTHLVVNVDENRRETVEQLAEFVPNVIVTHPLAPEDNPPLYRLLGDAFGAEREAERLCAEFGGELERVQAQEFVRRTVLYLIWRHPWMTVAQDTYIAAVLALVGLDTVAVDADARYPTVAIDRVDCDVVLLSSEPYRFRARHVPEVERATGRPVRLIDGELTSWYGSRAIQGLRYLGEYAHSL